MRAGAIGAALVTLALAVACAQPRPAPEGSTQTGKSAAAARPAEAMSAARVNPARAMQYVRDVVSLGPRPLGSAGHRQLESYLRSHLKGDNVEVDEFTATTPAGSFPMRNYIARYPGSKDHVIVVATHYDTLYPQKNFVGANDGGDRKSTRLNSSHRL